MITGRSHTATVNAELYYFEFDPKTTAGGIFGWVTISTQFLNALNKANPNDSWVTHQRNSLNSNANRPFVTHRPSLVEFVVAEGQIRAGNKPA